ncbi:ArsC family reductase [Rhizosphaericola mali]|uniref:ArsC family reductase n=1 Tax=Rhizosphaericola mali TaxID=2545455 RepID=A0A5P2FX27_9BACT|nr:ArsC family reductase [Rhizosphaericola mali]QES87467.1 ArsC family reductase [Rhizosphaericola mali]
MYTLYGIKNCNTVKKATTWLAENNIPFEFHDYKKSGITAAKLKDWISQSSWETLVNKKGSTWRMLDDTTKEKVTNAKAAIELMQEKTSVIKRPLIEKDGKIVTIGFDENEFSDKYK